VLAAVWGTALGAVGLAGLLIYFTAVLPDPLSLRHKERAPVVRILARDGAVLAERGAAHDYMPLDLLPRHVINAVVATEDRRFFEHWGLDHSGLVRAVFANLRAGRFAQGGSTLTQQLAKNLFLSPDRTIARKVEELALALWLELRLSKHDILELYLNRVYFGGGAYGIEAASQRYFDKSARELTISEAALVAGLLKAPSKYSPTSSPGAARARGRSVVQKMQDAGVITREQAKSALSQSVKFADLKASKDASGIEYAVDFVLERLPPLVGAGHAEVVVETTIDAALQRKVHGIIQSQLARHGSTLGVSQAAVSVLDADGGILALIGGRDYAESQFNRAVKAKRQPGSAFKPFVYLAALEAGMTPDTVANDLPLSVEGWAPRNDNGQHLGAMPLRRALAHSVNTVAVRLQIDIGVRRIVQTAQRLGIKSELREEPSLALGTSEVSLLEMTGAFGVLGNGGSLIQPHAIRRVRMSSGRVLYAREATRTSQVVAPANVGAMNDMLNAAVVSGTGRRAALARHAVAGKTGTTQDFRDAWFVGYTGHMTAGIWVGNDNGKPMNKVMGGSLPAEIWREIMTVAHEGRAPLTLAGLRGPMNGTAFTSSLPPLNSGNEREVLPWLTARDIRSDPRAVPRGQPPIVVMPPAPSAALRPAGSHGSSARAAAAASRKAYPTERIGANFLARVLDEPERVVEPVPQPGKAPDGAATGFDVEDIRARLQASADPAPVSTGRARATSEAPTPLPGMMSLGRGLNLRN